MKLLKINILAVLLVGFVISSCQDDWLDREPPNILLDDQVWNDVGLVTGVLSNFYDRLPSHTTLTGGWPDFAAYDEAIWSGYSGNDFLNNLVTYSFGRWGLWDYGLIRDINLSIDKLNNLSNLPEAQKTQFISELRFIRAYVYFEHVKRMGGVPIITEQLIYDFDGDPSDLQFPRNTEAEVYDFIADEVDAIIPTLGNAGSQTRANRFTALALKSRAMLYAASLAKYNSAMPSPITLPGGEVGIPAGRADEYFNASLEASRSIIQEGGYDLYNNNPDLGANFYELFINKSNNPEVIWAKDFSTEADKRHGFTYDNIARSVREDNLGSSAITPVLNLVEDFEYLDGSSGELVTRTADGSDFIYYDNVEDIFENKDARLFGTVVTPGSNFRGQEVFMQAGVMVWNGSSYDVVESNGLNTEYEDGGILTAAAGPHRSIQEVSNTGFYLRKYVDNSAGSSTRGIGSEVWWVRFRLGEIYLNAAEAAFELGETAEALEYINSLRERAGFGENSLTSLTLDRIRNERRVELAFEDHVVWDYKRWRIAHQEWTGSEQDDSSVMFALYPYRVVRPGDPRDDQYVFVKMVAPRFRAPRFFQLGNYYSLIGQNLIDANPKLVRNPFH
ncbi:RagB/SusD family nutrient uptake outer membrane protein [Echinicola jeungdonensis]|uniref:RagB/SusD family nutrient uptake outer membrane protein n=1 Tax=Echinicola jeungdonensis TaxID=709343 RepID=A0ABV5J1I1_9BACT|nr:RagB/SusD family nutrient uptake outer membrane protein [Echinicola jeungdonensis]MDN3668519.1 RagB/SusD family nutrient uptake outer membrane protein [Echinicola jeungdonensis]